MSKNPYSVLVSVLLFFITTWMFSCDRNLSHDKIISHDKNDQTTAADGQEISVVTMDIAISAHDVDQNNNRAADLQDQYEWPCFHGLDCQNKSKETGLMKTWPSGGPALVWSVSGLGEGRLYVRYAGTLYAYDIRDT